MKRLLADVEETIREHRLLSDGQSLVVAVSGGIDSMVLLHVLRTLSKRHSWRIVVAHFNHHLRGEDSAADEEFVREVSNQLGVRFIADGADVREYAREQSVSVEMAARTLRHEFLARSAAARGVETVALAHHADDQLELFFLRILRGAGGEGLSGMRWIGPSSSDPRIRLVRPFLSVTRRDLESFAEAEGISHRTDVTNDRLDCLRNRVRLELLPLLRNKYQPGLDKTVSRIMETVREDSDFIEQTARSALQNLENGAFERLHTAIQRSIVRSDLLRLSVTPEFDLIERLRRNPQLQIMVRPDFTVWRTSDGVLKGRTHRAGKPFSDDSRSFDLCSSEDGQIEYGGLKIDWRIEPVSVPPQAIQDPCPGVEYFDAASVGTQITLRHWQPGDRYQPIGMATPVKVQNLLTNKKIPRAQRHRLIVAATSANGIFWVEGLRISEHFKVASKTTRLLKWAWWRR